MIKKIHKILAGVFIITIFFLVISNLSYAKSHSFNEVVLDIRGTNYFLQNAYNGGNLKGLTVYSRTTPVVYSLSANPMHKANEISVFVQDGSQIVEMNFQEAIDKALLCPSNPSLFSGFSYSYNKVPSFGHPAKEIFVDLGGYNKDLQSLIVDQGFCSNPPPSQCSVAIQLMVNCGRCPGEATAGDCCEACGKAFICRGSSGWTTIFPPRTSCE